MVRVLPLTIALVAACAPTRADDPKAKPTPAPELTGVTEWGTRSRSSSPTKKAKS